MDRRTPNRIRRMDALERREYAASINRDLDRARAKQQRLAQDLQCTRDKEQWRLKKRRLTRLDRQVATLSEIVAFIDSL